MQAVKMDPQTIARVQEEIAQNHVSTQSWPSSSGHIPAKYIKAKKKSRNKMAKRSRKLNR